MILPNFIVDIDYKQLEFVIVSVLSNDKISLEWINTGKDAHIELAAIGFDVPIKEVLPTQRQCMKHVRYGMTYGAGWKKIHKTIQLKGYPECPPTVARRCVNAFKRTHPGVLEFQDELITTAKTKKYVEDPVTGRRIIFIGEPDIPLTLNYPIQATGAGIMNPKTLDIAKAFEGTQSMLLGQIHDSLVGEGSDPVFTATTMRNIMEAPVTIRGVTHSFLTDTEIGHNWGRMIKIERAGRDLDLFKIDQKEHKLFVSTYEDCVLEVASRLDYQWRKENG